MRCMARRICIMTWPHFGMASYVMNLEQPILLKHTKHWVVCWKAGILKVEIYRFDHFFGHLCHIHYCKLISVNVSKTVTKRCVVVCWSQGAFVWLCSSTITDFRAKTARDSWNSSWVSELLYFGHIYQFWPHLTVLALKSVLVEL